MALPLFATITIFIFIAHQAYQYWVKLKLPPGPYPWPFVGNLAFMKPLSARSNFELSKLYGPIVTVWFGSNLNVVVSNSELAKEVLKDQDQLLALRHRNKAVAITTRDGMDLIWADYGPHFLKARKVCILELFSPKRIEALRPIREDEVGRMVKSISGFCSSDRNHGKSLVLRRYLGSVAFNHVTRLLFGKRFENKEGVIDMHGMEYLAIVSDEYKLGQSLGLVENLWWLRWPSWLKYGAFERHRDRREHFVGKIMEEHVLERQKNGTSEHHFVDALLSLKNEYDLSEETIKGLLWDMIIAGLDTTAICVEWAMAQLIKNPQVQQKTQLEIDHIIGPNRPMSEPDISNLPYLRCVVKEALRLHPPTPLMLPHKASSNVRIGGYDIPKDTNVHVNVWAIGRDDKVWHEPLAFRPERFLKEKDVDMKSHDFRLLPFGAGRRMCPAAQLSINMVTLMVGRLLHHFSWSLPEGMHHEEIDMSEGPGLVMYMKTPLQAVPNLRSPAKFV